MLRWVQDDKGKSHPAWQIWAYTWLSAQMLLTWLREVLGWVQGFGFGVQVACVSLILT